MTTGEHRFRSVADALRQVALVRLDGYGGRSIADPERVAWQVAWGYQPGRVQEGTPATRVSDELAEAARALDAAFPVPWFLSGAPRGLTPLECQSLVVWRYVGYPGAAGGWVHLSLSELAMGLGLGLGADVTVHELSLLTRHGWWVVYETLLAKELVPATNRLPRLAPPEATEVHMAGEAVPWDLEGWDAIASAVGAHPTTARKWYVYDEMPVYRVGGRVKARTRELLEWNLSRAL